MAGPGFTSYIAQHIVTKGVKSPSGHHLSQDEKFDAEPLQTESWRGFFKNLFGLDGPKKTWKGWWDFFLSLIGFRI